MENGVRTLLRSILPAEYGLSTGFVVYHTDEGPRLSSQLDIIIYDALRSGPIVSLKTCDVFPLEAVYGYVEVKATLKSSSDEAEKPAENSIEKCLINNRDLRNMKDSYVFAFEAADAVTKDLARLAQRMADYAKKLGNPTHLHGLFIVGQGFLYTNPQDPAKQTQPDRVPVHAPHACSCLGAMPIRPQSVQRGFRRVNFTTFRALLRSYSSCSLSVRPRRMASAWMRSSNAGDRLPGRAPRSLASHQIRHPDFQDS